MISWWWVIPVAIVFYWLGGRASVWIFKRELKNPNSQIRKLLDREEIQEAEQYAIGAELYDQGSSCSQGCGRSIANMFRDVAKKNALTK